MDPRYPGRQWGRRTIAETPVSQTQVPGGSFLKDIWRNICNELLPMKYLSFENCNRKEQEIVSL